MFLKNCWYVAAWDYELIDGKMLARTLLGENVLLYRGDSGEVIALNNRCPHRGALLSQGRREGDSVRCMYHGIKYDHTGKCVQIPGQDMIPPKLRVRKYPIVESGHIIWIWMGGPAQSRDHARTWHFLYGDHVRARGSRRRGGQSPECARISQLSVHDAGDRAHDALLLGVPQQFRG